MKRFLLLIGLMLLTANLPAQALSGVTVNTLAGTGTVTVTTAAAHGIAVNQGFCLSIGSGICAVAVTVPTSTTLTFAGTQNCASACGTITPAKQIIVLQTGQPSGTQWTAKVLFWLTTTSVNAGLPGATSTWAGASPAENAALTVGYFVEQPRNYSFWTTQTPASVKTILQNDYNEAQTAFAASIQPAAYFGVFYNGAWSQ